MEEKKVQRSVTDLVKKGDKSSAKILAVELVRSKKAKERLYNSRATLNSIIMQLQAQLSMTRVAGAMGKSSEIMKIMNNAVKLPQIQKIVMAMGAEMTKAGLIEEMIEDTLDEGEELDDAADEEVDKILLEITQGVLNKGQKPPQVVPAAPVAEPVEEEDDEKDDALNARLAALRQ